MKSNLKNILENGNCGFSYFVNPSRTQSDCNSDFAQQSKPSQLQEDFSLLQEYVLIKRDILEVMISFMSTSHPGFQQIQKLLCKMMKMKVSKEDILLAFSTNEQLIQNSSYKLEAQILSTKEGQPVNEEFKHFKQSSIDHFSLNCKKMQFQDCLRLECSFFKKKDVLRALDQLKQNFITTQCDITKRSAQLMETADVFQSNIIKYIQKINTQQKIDEGLLKNLIKQENNDDLNQSLRNIPIKSLSEDKLRSSIKQELNEEQEEGQIMKQGEQTSSIFDSSFSDQSINKLGDIQNMLKQAQNQVEQIIQENRKQSYRKLKKKLKQQKQDKLDNMDKY